MMFCISAQGVVERVINVRYYYYYYYYYYDRYHVIVQKKLHLTEIRKLHQIHQVLQYGLFSARHPPLRPPLHASFHCPFPDKTVVGCTIVFALHNLALRGYGV